MLEKHSLNRFVQTIPFLIQTWWTAGGKQSPRAVRLNTITPDGTEPHVHLSGPSKSLMGKWGLWSGHRNRREAINAFPIAPVLLFSLLAHPHSAHTHKPSPISCLHWNALWLALLYPPTFRTLSLIQWLSEYNLQKKPAIHTPAAHTHAPSQITATPQPFFFPSTFFLNTFICHVVSLTVNLLHLLTVFQKKHPCLSCSSRPHPPPSIVALLFPPLWGQISALLPGTHGKLLPKAVITILLLHLSSSAFLSFQPNKIPLS